MNTSSVCWLVVHASLNILVFITAPNTSACWTETAPFDSSVVSLNLY